MWIYVDFVKTLGCYVGFVTDMDLSAVPDSGKPRRLPSFLLELFR